MSTLLAEQSNVTVEIEDLCSTLFNRWCENRRVVPLAYLMNSWPLTPATPTRIRRLSATLLALMNSDCNELEVEDCRLISSLVAIADNLPAYGSSAAEALAGR